MGRMLPDEFQCDQIVYGGFCEKNIFLYYNWDFVPFRFFCMVEASAVTEVIKEGDGRYDDRCIECVLDCDGKERRIWTYGR